MADVLLRVRLITEQALRETAQFRSQLLASLKVANEGIDRLGKTQAFTGLAIGALALAKTIELGAKATAKIANGIADATEKTVDAGRASAEFVRRLESAQKSTDKLVYSFGEAVSRSGAVQGALSAVDTAARELTRYLAGPEGRGAVDGFFRALALGAGGAIDAVLAAKRTIRDVLAYLMDAENAPKGSRAAALLGPPSDAEKAAQAFSERLGAIGVGVASPGVDDGARGLTTKAAKDAAKTAADRLRSQHEAERKQLADRDAFFRSGLEREREIAELTERVRQDGFDRAMENQARRQAIEAEQWGHRETGLIATLEAERGMWQRRNEHLRDVNMQAAEVASAGVATMFIGMGAAIGAGEGDLLRAAGRLAGGMVQQFGAMVVQLGAAGLAASLLGSVIPFLAVMTGGPAGVAASLATMTAGAAIVGAGAALGAAARPSIAAPRPSIGGAGSSFASSAPQGYQPTPTREMPPAVTVVFQGPTMGNPAELGRYLERALAASGRLRVGAT